MEGEGLSTKDQPKREKKPHESLVVRPYQEFTLFDPKTTDRSPKRGGLPLIGERLLQYITLETEILPGLPIEVMAKAQQGILRREAITPFDPELGYQVTDADYELESRIQKLLEIKREDKPIPGPLPVSIKDWLHFLRMDVYNRPPQEIPIEKAPLRILIGTTWSREYKETLLKAGLAESIRVGVSLQLVTVVKGEERTELDIPLIVDGLKFPPEVKEKLERLRMRLSFPSGYPHTFEAKPLQSSLDRFGSLNFYSFYPISKSREEPLATASFERVGIDRRLKNLPVIEREGLNLMVPSDFKKLSLIKASFYLAETTPN